MLKLNSFKKDLFTDTPLTMVSGHVSEPAFAEVQDSVRFCKLRDPIAWEDQ